MWDRYTENPAAISIYGWIERQKDSYKDFILLIYHKHNKNISWVSSSADYQSQISKVFSARETMSCQRAEDLYKDLKNVVKLNEQRTKKTN